MWHVWISVLCIQLAACDAKLQELTAVPQLIAPEVTLLQEQPQPPKKASEEPPEAQKQEGGKQRGGTRRGGPRRRPGQGPPGPEIKPPTGPMRIEPLMIRENRVSYQGELPERPVESFFRIQVRVTGERFPEIVGIGPLIVDEMIDDRGTVLVAPEDVKPEDWTGATPITLTRNVIARGFVIRAADVKPPGRDAHQLRKISGGVEVMYARKTEEIMIDDPLQYLDKYLEHPRLEELGIKIWMVRPGEEIDVRRHGRGIGLRFDQGSKRIRRVEFYDAWMKPLYTRDQRMETSDGEEYMYYGSMVGPMDADTQMLLKVFPEIEEERIRFTFENVELP